MWPESHDAHIVRFLTYRILYKILPVAYWFSNSGTKLPDLYVHLTVDRFRSGVDGCSLSVAQTAELNTPWKDCSLSDRSRIEYNVYRFILLCIKWDGMWFFYPFELQPIWKFWKVKSFPNTVFTSANFFRACNSKNNVSKSKVVPVRH
jgi:hypothetical protein